ncbi:hypothetical protein JIN85_09585 [Luteolibacter pohnpeiensis]|uniref:HipA-like kinase domain-containing protein n=1 Tax=Luteolibacter pohnpeiensis TaxID=454153 RepID=A0A934VWC3_9BACT|nr:HipA family kinase [Luteolibacter pohnpeiensis]MBK1882668.1 hypothetical protein [Luteolibacter pohnpeiensis]
MPLRSFTAVQFRRPMNRGLNKPFLAFGASEDDGGRELLVVKSKAGFGDRPEAMLREIFALQLARELGLNAPEPVWVKILPNFDFSAADHPEFPELIRNSLGWNIGTVHLGDDWKQWIHGTIPPTIEKSDLEQAYAFDAMVQNSDREIGNPNALWRGKQVAILDFDKAFAFLRSYEKAEKPWRETLHRQVLSRHCFHQTLRQVTVDQFIGQDLWDTFEEWLLKERVPVLAKETETYLNDDDLDLPRLETYFRKLAGDTLDFFRILTATTCK